MIRRWPAVRLLLVGVLLGIATAARGQDPRLITIPVEFEINGRGAGQIVLRARADLSEPAVQGSSLKSAVADRLTEATAESIRALPDGFVALGEIRSRGIELVLDVERLVLVLKAAELVRKAAPTRGTFNMGTQREFYPELRLPEADVSGYVNVRMQQTLFAHGRDAPRDHPFTADLQSVLNVRGWAFAAETFYSSRRAANDSHWVVGDLALTHDMPERALRWTVGDFSAPIGMLQAGTRMAGISLSREFTIQPYENYQPTGTAAFQLQEAATVEVFLNGVRMRTLKLEAGTYNLEDFNLAAGANDLALHITSASGRFEEINLTQFTARTLLRAGVSEFALSAGFPMTVAGDDAMLLGGETWLNKYYQRDPVGSAFVRRGLTDRFTGEINAQGAAYWQRVAAGFDMASPLGGFELYAALNRHEDTDAGSSVSLAWEHGLRSATLRLSTAYTAPHFMQVSPGAGEAESLAWNHAATISGPLPGGVDVTTSAYYQTMRNARSNWGWVARLTRRFGSFVGSLSVQARRVGGGTDTGGFVSVSWMQPPEWSVRTVLGAGDAAINPGFSAEANYTRRDGPRYVFADGAVESDDDGDHYRGGVRYQDNRFLAELAHRQVYASVFGQDRRSAETVGTLQFALAYADRAWGVTRRVDDGFAVITTHPRWRHVELGIDPAFGGFDHRVRPPFRAAVLGQLRAYRETMSFIQTVDSDQVLENSDFVFFPSYRRGTCVVIGSDAVYTVRGTLHGSDGAVLAYRALTVTPVDGGPEVTAFTNVAGRFVVGPIASGRWRIRCADSGEWAEFAVEGEETFQRLDVVQLHPAE